MHHNTRSRTRHIVFLTRTYLKKISENLSKAVSIFTRLSYFFLKKHVCTVHMFTKFRNPKKLRRYRLQSTLFVKTHAIQTIFSFKHLPLPFWSVIKKSAHISEFIKVILRKTHEVFWYEFIMLSQTPDQIILHWFRIFPFLRDFVYNFFWGVQLL